MRADQYGSSSAIGYLGTDSGWQIHTTYLRQTVPRRMDLLESPFNGNELGGTATHYPPPPPNYTISDNLNTD